MKKILIPLIMICCIHAQFTALLDFSGATNGRNPYSSLISDGTFLYGTTFQGGTNDAGTVFKIKTDRTSCF